MKQNDTSALREATIHYWATFTHARADLDVARVHAFQALVRDRDLDTVTDDDVTEAYGGPGWAPVPVCYECGARSDDNVLFGPKADLSLCADCIDKADALQARGVMSNTQPSFFTRLFRKGA